MPVPPVVVCATDYGNNFLMIGIATPALPCTAGFRTSSARAGGMLPVLTPQPWSLLARAG